MDIIPVRTRPLLPPRDNLFTVIEASLPPLTERDVLCVSSKVVAIHQGRCVKMGEGIDKNALIHAEAERVVPLQHIPGHSIVLTLKDHTLIPSAGIDESNGNGYYILWPEQPYAFARELWTYLRKKFGLNELGVIVTDSHTVPLRYGVLGVSIGFFGFHPVESNVGRPDIFGRPLEYTNINVVDALAVTAVFAMGEGAEQTPLAILRGADRVAFTADDTAAELLIPPELDLYKPLLDCFYR